MLPPLQKELMSWHHRLYHFPFRILFRLSRKLLLPKQFIECRNKPLFCIAYQFGQAHYRPWQTKCKKGRYICKTDHKGPGDGITVDKIISAKTGLIPQMSGFLTNKRLWGCTTFVENKSDYVYVRLMWSLSSAEILTEKLARKKVISQSGHMVKHCHADNGSFADNAFINAINEK